MAFLLGCEKVRVEFPTKTVFESVSLGVDEGDRIGIVGRNGDGKSTLLALLAGELSPDAGRVLTNGAVHVGMLGQTDHLDDDATVGEAIVGDRPEYEWAGDPRIRDVIAGLARDIPWDAQVGTLSGGQRRRVDLARLLIGDWDVLALDEPTNHLDVRAITWLAKHLKGRWKQGAGALLVVTHDRWFLDEVCTGMWEVHDRQVEPFEGGFSAYIMQRVERDRLAALAEQKRQNELRRELAWLSRGKDGYPDASEDPKCHFVFTNAGFRDLFRLLDSVTGPKWSDRVPKDLPIVLFSGEMDPVGSYGKGPRQVYGWLKASGVRDLSLKLYPDARHELHNELNRDEFLEDVVAWCDRHMEGGRQPLPRKGQDLSRYIFKSWIPAPRRPSGPPPAAPGRICTPCWTKR